jgi:hypothetical protein
MRKVNDIILDRFSTTIAVALKGIFLYFHGLSFAKSLLFPILTPMQTINVKVCTGRSCTERQSTYIKTRLDADREFYNY